MKEKIFDFLKGIAIGIANIIPGFSGGSMAVILKVYDKFIYALGNFFNHPIQVIQKAWGLFLGIVVGLVLGALTIVKLLELFPVPTSLFFVGLIIGSIPGIFIEAGGMKKITIKEILAFLIAVLVLVGLPFLQGNDGHQQNVHVGTMILVFVFGLICSGAMVIPGVSGSLVLMAFGYYTFLMEQINILIADVVHFEFSGFLNSFLIVLFFAIGAILGMIFISKAIAWLMKKFPKTVYFAILGLLLASPFSIIYAVIQEYNEQVLEASPFSWIVGVFFLALGAFLAGFSSFYEKKSKKSKKEEQKDTNEKI